MQTLTLVLYMPVIEEKVMEQTSSGCRLVIKTKILAHPITAI